MCNKKKLTSDKKYSNIKAMKEEKRKWLRLD